MAETVTFVKGQFQYRDKNGVVHEVEAIRGPDGKSAYQYALESGLIDGNQISEQDFKRACGEVYQELAEIRAAHMSLQALAIARDQANSAAQNATNATFSAKQTMSSFSSAYSSAMSAASAANDACDAAMSAASSAGSAYLSALSALSSMSQWNNAFATVSGNERIEEPSVFVSSVEIPNPSGNEPSVISAKKFDFRIPMLHSAVQGCEKQMIIQSGIHVIDTTVQSIKSTSFYSSFAFPSAFTDTPFCFCTLINPGTLIHSTTSVESTVSNAKIYGTSIMYGTSSNVNTSADGCAFTVSKGNGNYYYRGSMRWMAIGTLASTSESQPAE